jgi:hypothetical protein
MAYGNHKGRFSGILEAFASYARVKADRTSSQDLEMQDQEIWLIAANILDTAASIGRKREQGGENIPESNS